MRVTTVLVLLLIGLSVAGRSVVLADTWLPPRPRIYASPDGIHGFKVIPAEPRASATLFTLTDKGEEQTTWQGLLVNIPHRVFVADVGSVVTVDTYARLGYEHALVVYDAKGKLLADYPLEGLLTGEEIAAHVTQTAGSRWWNSDAEFRFSPGGETFAIKLNWGKVITVELKTGKLLPQT